MLCLHPFSRSVLLFFLGNMKSNKDQGVIKCKPFGENNEEIFWSTAFISGNLMVFRHNCDDIICFWRWASAGTAGKPSLPSPGRVFFFFSSRLLTLTTHFQCFLSVWTRWIRVTLPISQPLTTPSCHTQARYFWQINSFMLPFNSCTWMLPAPSSGSLGSWRDWLLASSHSKAVPIATTGHSGVRTGGGWVSHPWCTQWQRRVHCAGTVQRDNRRKRNSCFHV